MKTAVVLLSMGGASDLKSVRTYLYNIFSDPLIIKVSNPWRNLIAWGLSQIRKKKTSAIYRMLGGRSPLLESTNRQSSALATALGPEYRVFISMRYWHPRAEEVLKKIKEYNPDLIVLLPLYPQYSTSITQSSVKEFEEFRLKELPDIPCEIIQCYPQQEGFIWAVVDQIRVTIQNLTEPHRLLFTAHGLPLKRIQQGDPYQAQVEETVAKVISLMNFHSMDYQICYQSRVGILPWLKPYTIDEIKRAGVQKKSIILVPISFVSENSETLYELDIQYKEIAKQVGVPEYYRVPTVSEHPLFIQGLADLIKQV